MQSNWNVLTNRLGIDFSNPSDSTLENVITDFRSHLDDKNHPSIHLRSGNEDGGIDVIELFVDGSLIYSKYSDDTQSSRLSGQRANELGILDITRRFRYVRDRDNVALRACSWAALPEA